MISSIDSLPTFFDSKKKTHKLSGAGFEPARLAPDDLKSSPLDRSGIQTSFQRKLEDSKSSVIATTLWEKFSKNAKTINHTF